MLKKTSDLDLTCLSETRLAETDDSLSARQYSSYCHNADFSDPPEIWPEFQFRPLTNPYQYKQ